MAFWNVEPHHEDVYIRRGDTWDQSFRVKLNDGSDPLYPAGDPHYYFDMTGMRLDVTVKDKAGNIVKQLSSAGTSPALTIYTSIWNVDTTGFDLAGEYDYDVQLTNGTDIATIGDGEVIVSQDKTA
jgi:hypothetical protein